MSDKARRDTDKQLEQMEKELDKIYRDAQSEITEKWNAYMSKEQSNLDSLRKAYLEAPDDEKAAAKRAYKNAAIEYTLQNKHYKDMLSDVTDRIADVNDIATRYINDRLVNVYMMNYNQKVDGLSGLGIRFNLIDESTIRRMVKDGDIKLPYKNLDRIKDKLWNTKQLNSSVLQGILQGESMKDIAARILPVVNNDKNAAIRNARTMVTGAENRGRSDRYHDLEEDGAVIRKVWISTEDERTREWHATMDGQEVELDEPFVDGLGNEIMYPADPSGAPETVYNCRCSMKSHVIGFRRSDGTISLIGR